MHMGDALVSPAVGITMMAVSAGVMAYSLKSTEKTIEDKKVPVMGVMGAFVFAAQMINFTIPATGSSGHIGGGMLLAALLGGAPAFLVMAAVLIIQCLFFSDGGLLALGCNVFNMGFYSCLLSYPLIYKPIMKRGITKPKIVWASVLSTVVGLQLGAFSVVLQTLFSGITELPFGVFAAFMQPIHLAIGVVEGLITAGVLCFIYSVRPELMESAVENKPIGNKSIGKIAVIMIIAAAVVGGGLSYVASEYPDGLEWAIANVSGKEEQINNGEIHKAFGAVQEKTAIMPDYAMIGDEESSAGTGTAGIVGGVVTFILAFGVGFVIYKVKKRKTEG